MGPQIWSYYKFSPGSNIVIFHDLAELFGNWPLEDLLTEIPAVRLSGSWALSKSGQLVIWVIFNLHIHWRRTILVWIQSGTVQYFSFYYYSHVPNFHYSTWVPLLFCCPFVLALHDSLGKQRLSVSVGLHEHVCMSFSLFSHIKNGIS